MTTLPQSAPDAFGEGYAHVEGRMVRQAAARSCAYSDCNFPVQPLAATFWSLELARFPSYLVNAVASEMGCPNIETLCAIHGGDWLNSLVRFSEFMQGGEARQ